MKRYILRRALTGFDSVSQYIRKLVCKDNYYQRELTKSRNQKTNGNVPKAPIPSDRAGS